MFQRFFWVSACLSAGLLCIHAPAFADDDDDGPPAPQTGNGKAPSVWTSTAVLTSEFDDLVHGGLNPGIQAIHNLDLTAVWHGDDGWEAHGYVLGNFGGGFSADRVGDAQVISNIDTVPAWRLFEAYVRHTGPHWITSFGLMNLNGVFDVQKPAKLFENPSHGIGPDFSQTAPSIFPITALGGMATWIIAPGLKWRAGVFDGVAGDPAHPKTFVAVKLGGHDGVNYITEVEKDFSHAYVKVDHWGYSSTWQGWDGRAQRGNSGDFIQAAMTSDPAGKYASGTNGWVRFGVADPQVNRIDRYLGLGITTGGPTKGDQMGIAFAQVHFGHPYRDAAPGTEPFETNYEATFTHAINARLSLQPDIQYVHRPYGQSSTPDALVMSVRFVVDLLGGE
ncbi:MAG: carbohydrate porin [Asticcacaulis sp.]